MTQEEKAKRYDEAIKKLRSLHDNYDTISTLIDIKEELENIFPELKESEDERIRKALTGFLKSASEGFLDTEIQRKTFGKWAAWLANQGDTNETINSDKFVQGVLRGAAINLITWIDYNAAKGNMCLSNMECEDIEDALVSGDWNKIYTYIKKKLEKQGEQKQELLTKEKALKNSPFVEQKPTTKLEYDENGEPILTSFEAELFSMMSDAWQGYMAGEEVNIAKIVKEHSAELLERANEQKPVVDDKDAEKASEEYRNFRMSCGIKDPVMLNEIEEAYYEGAIRKQKPACSEEEEDNIDGICYLITENCDAEKASELITWLKSFRPYNTWKPSNEQMDALETAVSSLQSTALESLYQDLKKL